MALISNKDKIFVAGHKGLVGSAVVRELNRQGYQNIITKTRVELDLLNANAVEDFFKKEKPDVVFLAAAKVGGIYANNTFRADFIYENLQMQNNVIWNAFKQDTHRFIFLGSSCIYPRECPHPIKEEYLLTGKLEYTNQPYAVAKIAGIELIHGLRKQYNKDYFCVMPTNLFGLNDNYHPENSHVLPALIRKFVEAKTNNSSEVIVWGDGTPLREFMYSDDLASALVYLAAKFSFEELNNSALGNKNLCHINAGSHFEISVGELARKIAQILEYKGKIVFDTTKPNGTMRKIMDSSFLQSLGWKSAVSFDEALAKTVREFIHDNGSKIT